MDRLELAAHEAVSVCQPLTGAVFRGGDGSRAALVAGLFGRLVRVIDTGHASEAVVRVPGRDLALVFTRHDIAEGVVVVSDGTAARMRGFRDEAAAVVLRRRLGHPGCFGAERVAGFVVLDRRR